MPALSSLRARQRLGNGLHFFCRLHRRRDLRLSQLAVYTVHIDKLRPYDTSRPTSFQTRILDGSQNHFPLSPFRHLPYLAQAESLMERKCLGNPFQTSKSRYNSKSCRFGKAALRTQQTNQGLRSREVIPKTHHRDTESQRERHGDRNLATTKRCKTNGKVQGLERSSSYPLSPAPLFQFCLSWCLCTSVVAASIFQRCHALDILRREQDSRRYRS